MGKLVDVLTVNLQLLSAYCIAWSIVCTAGLWCFCTARAEGVEEFVLSFARVRRGSRGWTGVFLFQIVPLPLLAGTLARSHHGGTCMLVFWAPR
jgi:hypothetical protein